MSKSNGPKVLLLDIETSPIISQVWGLFDQNVGLSQIRLDAHLLAWSAKWLGDPDSKIMYMDQRDAKNVEDDRKLLKGIWELMDEADICCGQNSRRFDVKRLNARFIINGMQPPSPFKQIDTLEIARRKFGFTSNKLEFLSSVLCPDQPKHKSKKFPGFELWKECLAGNQLAWREMEIYNKQDIFSLEAVLKKLLPWDQRINFNLYRDDNDHVCNCGSRDFERRGYNYTIAGKHARYRCRSCGAWSSSKDNEFTVEKRKSLRKVL